MNYSRISEPSTTVPRTPPYHSLPSRESRESKSEGIQQLTFQPQGAQYLHWGGCWWVEWSSSHCAYQELLKKKQHDRLFGVDVGRFRSSWEWWGRLKIWGAFKSGVFLNTFWFEYVCFAAVCIIFYMYEKQIHRSQWVAHHGFLNVAPQVANDHQRRSLLEMKPIIPSRSLPDRPWDGENGRAAAGLTG